MIVHKFGGTSVGDADCFMKVADIIGNLSCPAREAILVVVSAMSGVTDELIAMARAAAESREAAYHETKAGLLRKHLRAVDVLFPEGHKRQGAIGLVKGRLHDLKRLCDSIAVLGELTARGSDAVAAFGEQLSADVLAALLRDRGITAQSVSAAELIVTDAAFGRATPLAAPTSRCLRERLVPLFDQGILPVITGYIAATEQGVITTLGRGGSDYTAAIIGAGMNAREVWIWSDVDGILTADPSIVGEARTISQLSYVEAAELAYFGAEVLHPKTIQPLAQKGIPLRLRNTFNPAHPGTMIVATPEPGRQRWPAIISSVGLTLIAIGTGYDSWSLGTSARALQLLSDAGVEVRMLSQSFSEDSLNLVVPETDQAHCLDILRRGFQKEKRHKVSCKERVAAVSTVGPPEWNGDHIVSGVLAALGKCGTRIIAVAQAAGEHSISFCIPEDQLKCTVRFLHHELGLDVGYAEVVKGE
jgi:bifunctional aspartokinase / homoserine dehydrogenase 1